MKYQGKSALVVDDDVDLLEQVALTLRQLGFDVLEATSQEAAQKLLETHQPDIAVVDLMLEHEDSGFVLAHAIKKRNAAIPVVLITAVTSELGMEFDASTDEERQWIKADVLLNKPVRPEQLEKEVTRLLGR